MRRNVDYLFRRGKLPIPIKKIEEGLQNLQEKLDREVDDQADTSQGYMSMSTVFDGLFSTIFKGRGAWGQVFRSGRAPIGGTPERGTGMSFTMS